LDTYSGYHQSSLVVDDELKTTFITSFGIFCYIKMAFGLKNGHATYQKGVQIVLKPQIERNNEAYIDDVVKSKKLGDLLVDLKEMFNNLHKCQLQLNRKKCEFGVSSRTLLGTWCWHKGSTLTQRKLKPLNDCNHPEHDEKSKS
jgi:hypothetical protein